MLTGFLDGTRKNLGLIEIRFSLIWSVSQFDVRATMSTSCRCSGQQKLIISFCRTDNVEGKQGSCVIHSMEMNITFGTLCTPYIEQPALPNRQLSIPITSRAAEVSRATFRISFKLGGPDIIVLEVRISICSQGDEALVLPRYHDRRSLSKFGGETLI